MDTIYLEKHYETPDPFQVKINPADANRKRVILAILKRIINRFRDGRFFKRVLDIGCGEGWITQDIPAEEIVGYDIATNALARCPDNVATVSSLDQIEGEFDLIILAGVLVEKYDTDSFIGIIKKHASGIVLTCQTDITEISDISRFEELEFYRINFPYREHKQILRLFNFGSQSFDYSSFNFTPGNNTDIESSQSIIESEKKPKVSKPYRYAPQIEHSNSEEANSESDSLLPTIGYLCMTFDPIDMLNAVHDFYCQNWPRDKKKLYLLRQRDNNGQFPSPLINNIGLQIVERDIDGAPWPELWTLKFKDYIEVCDCDYTLWWDEDDRYPPDYTRRAMKPILDGQGPLAWNWDCIIAEYDVYTNTFQFRDCWYRTPIAQLAIETKLLKHYGELLISSVYSGKMKSAKRYRGIPTGTNDDRLRQMLQLDIETIPHHRGKRTYFVHGQAHSASLRLTGNSLDYKGKRGDKNERVKGNN